MQMYIICITLVLNFFAGCKSLNSPPPTPKKHQIDVQNMTILELHENLLKHKFSCEDFVNLSIERIKAYNLSSKDSALLNSIVQINNNSIRIARELDSYLVSYKKLKGPLHCVTVAVKDNINTYDMTTSAGSLSLLRSQPNGDAEAVRKMRDAGAVIFLKTSMDEFAAGMLGQSSLSGRTGNVFDAQKNPGGSSGGSAVAVAAAFAVVGLGSDNSGSVRIPAAFNGVYGLRPSKGLINHRGVFPRGALDGELGPMARNLSDLAIVFKVLRERPKISTPEVVGLKGLRIGVVQEIAATSLYEKSSAEAKARYEGFFRWLKLQGAVLKDISFDSFNINREHNMAGEVEDINAYLRSFPAAREDYRDVCLSKRQTALGSVEQCLEHVKNNKSQKSDEYYQVVAMFKKNQDLVEQKMAELQVDVLLSPISYEGEPSYDPQQVLTWQLPLSSNSGLPALNIFIGYSQAAPPLPVFMEILGTHHSDEMLIKLAQAIGDRLKVRSFLLEAFHQECSLLKDFDIPMLNNLFATIGWKIFYTKDAEISHGLINPTWFKTSVMEIIKSQRKSRGAL